MKHPIHPYIHMYPESRNINRSDPRIYHSNFKLKLELFSYVDRGRSLHPLRTCVLLLAATGCCPAAAAASWMSNQTQDDHYA